MKLLQAITKLNNNESDCPVKLEMGELYHNEESMVKTFKLKFKCLRSDVSAIYADIACYDINGNILSVIEGIPCENGVNFINSPSFITAGGAVIVRSVMLDDGMWESEAEFSKTIEKINPYKDEQSTSDIEKEEPLQEALEEIDFEKTDRISVIDDKLLLAEQFIDENVSLSKKKKRKKRWVILPLILVLLCTLAAIGYGYVKKSEAVFDSAMTLYNNESFDEAFLKLKEADKYVYAGYKNKEVDWCLGICYARQRDFINAAICFRDLGNYKKSRENYQSIMHAYTNIYSKGDEHTAWLTEDGKIKTSGSCENGQCDVGGFINITQVSAGGQHTVAINKANKCIARGNNADGQCDIGKWENIFDISAGKNHTVAIDNLGRAKAVGDNTYGQCDVNNWSGVVQICAGAYHTVGLTIDGKVLAVGRNKNGECNTEQWNNVVMVAAGDSYTLALTYDGEVLRCGNNETDALDTISKKAEMGELLFITADAKEEELSDIAIPVGSITIFKK